MIYFIAERPTAALPASPGRTRRPLGQHPRRVSRGRRGHRPPGRYRAASSVDGDLGGVPVHWESGAVARSRTWSLAMRSGGSITSVWPGSRSSRASTGRTGHRARRTAMPPATRQGNPVSRPCPPCALPRFRSAQMHASRRTAERQEQRPYPPIWEVAPATESPIILADAILVAYVFR